MNDNIKVIDFKNNILKNGGYNDKEQEKNNNLSENVNNKELDNVEFNLLFNNNNNAEDFIKKNNKEIIIHENIAIDDKNLVYKDDTIYLQELENQLLSNYPVTKQNDKYVIERVQQRAKDIIELKNLGIKRYNLLNKDIEYNKKLEIINNDFSDNWIIPIVNDNHIIFTNINEIEKKNNNNENINENKLITQLEEDPSGYTEIEQKELLLKLKENNKLFEENKEKKLTINSYEEINSELYKSYEIKKSENNYIINSDKSYNVIRNIDKENKNWNSYKVNNDLYTPVNKYDENDKIIGIKKEILINSEHQNILGFLKLKEGGKNILKDYKNILFDNNYKNHLYQVLYNKKNISNIEKGEKNQIKIRIEDHEINEKEIIYLNNTNCYPKIDGYYNCSEKIKIIDKDNIELNNNNKIIIEGNSGQIYKLSKLKYDYYNINEKLDFEYLYSTYDNKEEQEEHNKIYIFKDIQVNSQKYIKILNKIIPNIDKIIENEKNNLEKCENMNEIEEILKKYYVKINDINEEHYKKILNYLKKNSNKIVNKFSEEKIYQKINYFYKNKEFLNENNYFLNDSYLLDKEVIKYYGKYPYLDKSFDSIKQRYNWLKNKDDNGELYIKLINLQKENTNKNQIKYIENKIKEIKENINELKQDILEKNDKVSKCNIYKYSGKKIESLKIDKEKDIKYYLLENRLYEFIEDELKEVENIEEEDILLLDNLELHVYKNNKWEFTKEYSKYNKIKYLCEFKNIDIQEIELDSLDCIYRKDFGCYSKTSLRKRIILEELEKSYNNFDNLLKSIKKEIKKNDIKLNIKEYTNKYDLKNENISTVKKINKNIKSFNSIIPIDILVKKIFKLNDIELRENYFYQLIDKDCILIDNYLYSKKYKKEILCGHYYYLKKIYYSDNDNNRQKYIDKLISIFSDQGETEKNNHTCRICGEKLINNEYDDTEGFATSGALIISRETWVKEKTLELSKKSMEEYLLGDDVINCENNRFSELLLENGLDLKNIEKAEKLCQFITKTIYPKIGIKLPNGVFINNIIEMMQKIDIIIPFNIFKISEKKRLLKSITSKRIESMEKKEYFENKYKIIYEMLKESIIVSRILISIQVNIPNLEMVNKTTNCIFNGFNEKDGIDFFACILNELNNKKDIGEEDKLKKYKQFIKQYYDEYKSYYYIKELFKEKKKYILSLKRDKIYDKIEEKEQIYKFEKEPKKIDTDGYKILKNIKTYNEYKNIYNLIKERNIFVNQKIKEIINDIISRSPLSDKLGGLIERSCCSQEVSTYLDFYQYLELFDENSKILDYINESKDLNKLLETKLINSNFHRFKLYDENKFVGNENKIIVYDGNDISDKFIKSVFINYVNEGVYKGTTRDYVEEYRGIKDVKTGKTLEEIENKEYSKEELNDLLNSIEKNNMRFINNIENKDKFDKEFINKIKKESINGLKIQINLLINNVVNILGKNKEYENRLYEIINNIKKNNINNITNSSNIRERINEENSKNNNKLKYYKSIYQKIGKYLSIIKNNLEFDKDKKFNLYDDSKRRNEMKLLINQENSKLDELLKEEIIIKFQNINMKYDISKVNAIYGNKNILDKDGNKTIKYSEFTTLDACNLLEYIVFEQMNLLFDNKDYLKIADKSVKNKYIAQLINIILNEIEEDYELYDICNKNNEFEHLDARFHNAYQLKILTTNDKYDVKDFLKSMSESSGVSLDSQYNTIENEFEIEDQKKDILDSITDINKFEKIKEGFLESNENNDELSLIDLKQIKKQIDDENEYIEDESFGNEEIIKNKDIIESGNEYGTLNEFDFETGDGFPENEYDYE